MNNKKFNFVVFMLLIAFAAVSVSGCGGGSSNSGSVGGGNAKVTVLDEESYDSDGDGTPEVLDFSDVEQKYYGENDPSQDIKISSIPSLHFLKNAKTNNGISLTADLKAGTEYTIEISESAGVSGSTEVTGYAYPIETHIPDVKVINPQGTELEFLDLGTFDENYDSSKVIDLKDDVIEVSHYPTDNPYMLCFTFTPSVSGSYKINFNRADSETADADEGAFERVPTLFIYEELRSGTSENGAGYYKLYKFQDVEGNISDTINMTDIMELRKAFNNEIYNTLSTALTMDGKYTDNGTWLKVPADQAKAYLRWFYSVRPYYGIFDGIDVDNPETEADDASIENYPEEEVSVAAVDAVSVAATSKDLTNSGGARIKQKLIGFPYKQDTFGLGTGYFAITGVQAGRNAVEEFELPVPTDKFVTTHYNATFVSSQEERETLSKKNAGASVAIGGFGIKGNYSSEANFKFGLTSTTFVVHYDELENKYRELKSSEYKLADFAKELLDTDFGQFRERYGDYFVAGYQFGGTFDAFMTITTETMEQLKDVKTQFSIGFNTEKGAASADVGTQLKETLKKNKATINIFIVTAGIDVKGLDIPSTTTDINEVIKGLNAFRQRLQQTDPKYYMETYAMLKRYSILADVDRAMYDQGYGDLIPIPYEHSKKIMAFNKEKMIMDSYYNVIKDLKPVEQIDSDIQNQYAKEYESITNDIGLAGNEFFAVSNTKKIDSVQTAMENINVRLKALGDRYAFIQVLIAEQAKELACAGNSVTDKPFGPNGGTIGVTNFNVSDAVTSDMAAGRTNFSNKINEIAVAGDTEQFWNYTAELKNEDAETKKSDAVFYYIRVSAPNTSDRKRDVLNSPCIGKNQARFYFLCGGDLYWKQWETELWSMRFNKKLYPFGGLK